MMTRFTIVARCVPDLSYRVVERLLVMLAIRTHNGDLDFANDAVYTMRC